MQILHAYFFSFSSLCSHEHRPDDRACVLTLQDPGRVEGGEALERVVYSLAIFCLEAYVFGVAGGVEASLKREEKPQIKVYVFFHPLLGRGYGRRFVACYAV